MEDYGLMQCLKVFYTNGLEAEFGIGSLEWAKTRPIDKGTKVVIRDGCKIICDKKGILSNLINRV